jgi:N6-L-threonylcarbamoyladenine synthase
MLCLGIETSCDETALALVRDGALLDQVLASQADTHALFGGVVPELASREHYRFIGPLYDLLLRRNGLGPDAPEVCDLVAVARGPGLLGCLLVGVAFAKGIALGSGAGLLGVNHLHAHLLAAGLERELPFPALGLLISGGHTHLYRMEGPDRLDVLGKTLDDAAGEACDKFAKMLHLPYPGGAVLDALAQGVEPDVKLFPRPHTRNASLDFSFSGLKTAAASYLAGRPELVAAGKRVAAEGVLAATEDLRLVSAAYARAVADTLRIKTELALDLWPGMGGAPGIGSGTGSKAPPKALIVAGGVAANTTVRAVLGACAAERGITLILPSLPLCTDNAAMIAHAGWLLGSRGYRHDLTLSAVPRGRAVPDDYRLDTPEGAN